MTFEIILDFGVTEQNHHLTSQFKRIDGGLDRDFVNTTAKATRMNDPELVLDVE